jgi:hypothetical protein
MSIPGHGRDLVALLAVLLATASGCGWVQGTGGEPSSRALEATPTSGVVPPQSTEGTSPVVPPAPIAPPTTDAARANEPDARDPVGAVAALAALCDRARQGDHDWVAARVELPLRGIHSLNAVDEDPLVHPNENPSVQDFQYERYCQMLPESGTALREFQRTETTASGIVEFGKVPHRVEFDLTHDPPRLTTVDAQVAPRPIPARVEGKRRAYELGAPPPGFTDREPPGSEELRRRVIRVLEADRRCIDDYVARNLAAVRFQVIVEAGPDGRSTVRVEPFQLVRVSLLACLRTQLAAAPTLTAVDPTSAILQVLIPVSADEMPPGTPTLEMGSVVPG